MKNQNGLALFNAMKAEAKALGIDITGMKKAEIEAAIAAKQEVEPQVSDVVIEITNEGVTKKKYRPVEDGGPTKTFPASFAPGTIYPILSGSP